MSLRQSQGERDLDETIAEFNKRPDVLTAIVKHRTDVKGQLGYLHIAKIDPNPMNPKLLILYHPPPNHEEHRVEIPMNPLPKTIMDIRPQVHYWKSQAIKHFQLPDQPLIDYYSPPSVFPYTLPLTIALSVLLFALFGWGHHADALRAMIAQKGHPYLLRIAAGLAAFMHFVSEPAFMMMQLRKYNMPFNVGWKWILTVICLGYAAIDEWNECLEYERIRDVYRKTDVGELPPRIDPVTKEKKRQ